VNFKRKQRIKGRTAKTYKEWYSDCEQYRISWRSEVFDVSVAPGYHACVRSGEGWGFAQRRGLYRTLKAAKDACEMNWKLWNKFLSIEGRGKVTQVRNLMARAMIGRGNQAYSGMSDLPVWVKKKASPRLLEVLQGKVCESPSDPTPIWKNTDSDDLSAETTSGPASDAMELEARRPHHGSETVEPAKGPAKAARKKSSKRTAKKSKRGKKKSKRTKKKSKSVRKR
jgi:hypothetical protein